MHIFLIFIFSLLHKNTFASETDAYTLRYAEIKDATESINHLMNDQIQNALMRVNRSKKIHITSKQDSTCSMSALNHALGVQLRRPLYGKIDEAINRSSGKIPVMRVSHQNSVFRELNFFEGWTLFLGKMGLGNVIRIKGFLIGSDKFGHLLDEGYHYFKERNRLIEKESFSDHQAILQAMQYGKKTEDGIFGIKASGVRSYADMVANFNGLIFWSEVFDQPLDFRKLEHKPYFSCDNGKWIQIRKFNVNDYVDAGFDEGINCSDFREGTFKTKVEQQIIKLEETFQKPFRCPVAPDECKALVKNYGDFAATLLHPLCFAKGHEAE